MTPKVDCPNCEASIPLTGDRMGDGQEQEINCPSCKHRLIVSASVVVEYEVYDLDDDEAFDELDDEYDDE